MAGEVVCGDSATRNQWKGVWVSCAPQHPSWTAKDSGGDLPGQSCTRADALRKQRPVNPANGPLGWQYWASSVLDAYQRKNSMLTNLPASRQAHLHSHSGRNAPTAIECPSAPVQSPVAGTVTAPLAADRGNVQRVSRAVDRGACTRSGRVKKRASPTDRMLARVCREAGARVKFNAYLRDMN